MAEEVTVHLPLSVENLIQNICMEQHQNPLDSKVRHHLALIGEQQALQLLTKISRTQIKTTFTKFTQYMINTYYTPSTSEKQQHNSNASPSSPATTHLSFTSPSNQISFGTTHSPVAEHQRRSLNSSTQIKEEKGFSAVMEAFGELEFRKAFLLLSYIGGESLENAITAEMIRSLKDLPMVRFEKEIWDAVGKRYMNSDKKERQLYLDWDSGRSHVYHCYVSPNGSLRFKGPILQKTWTHLQKSLGDENVLVVKFAEETNVRDSVTNVQEPAALYRKFGKEGIHVGLRLYRFFGNPVFLSLFMHVHMLANLDKYMARFSLILSKTLTLKIDLATVHVEDIGDIICKDENGNPVYDSNDKARIHTDGTGFISADLAVLCPCNVSEGRDPKNKHIGEITNLVDLEEMSKETGGAECRHQPVDDLISFCQFSYFYDMFICCRLFHMGSAIKGTLLLNRKLPPRTIQVRPSMIKVPRDKSLLNIQSINSLEVVGTSNKPNRSYLSKYLIALLSYGGVPNEFFMDVLRSNLEEANRVYSNKRAALKASLNHGDMDDYNLSEMILAGISLNEPFLQYHLSILAIEEKKRLRAGKLYVSDCFYLMGTVDPTGRLKRNEVCIIHENGQIRGPVLVYRNPGLHFGDIHMMQATYVEELESYVGHSKYAIFFPCVGPRSVADEIAGGDFDGDMYWVSKNPQLLQYFKSSDPWVERTAPCNAVSSDSSVEEPSVISDELEEQLFGLYLRTRFEPSSAVGVAADSWMALMDRLLTLRNRCNKEKQIKHLKESILQLIDIYYEALDAPKKGGRKFQVPKDLAVEMFPHYMEKNKSFTSTSIVGSIYDEVGRWQEEDLSRKEITKLPCFDVEIPVSCMEKWKALYEEYRKDMKNALNHNSNSKDEAAEVIKIYQEKLYGAARTEDSLYYEALAVYHVTYDYAIQRNDVKKCAFAWKVAGSTLTNIYIVQQNLNARVFNPSVLREIFCS
ncbi:hypothetical protein TanjilG_29736 [Lupinus angustifolius]|uniref:RNA-dependent RNA polymerase n=1 Tax=Lupinus angustifolius TaxID=3871 RepID=A0A1J7HPN4_LUPAN|nr:hypothetical protein TanjilG_29736 [Lupinus angustifolius]